MSTSTGIKSSQVSLPDGINSLYHGAWLSDQGYKFDPKNPDYDYVPPGYERLWEDKSPWINDPATGLQAGVFKKDGMIYVLVAGTNELFNPNAPPISPIGFIGQDVLLNWSTKGFYQFKALDQTLNRLVKDYGANRIVVTGDSGGGFVVQYAFAKYGVNGFATNTTGIWNFAIERDDALYNPNGKMITVETDGQILATLLGFTQLGQVILIPSKQGWRFRFFTDEVGMDRKAAATSLFLDGITAHMDREYMKNYLKNPHALVYSPGSLTSETYRQNHPSLLEFEPDKNNGWPDSTVEYTPMSLNQFPQNNFASRQSINSEQIIEAYNYSYKHDPEFCDFVRNCKIAQG